MPDLHDQTTAAGMHRRSDFWPAGHRRRFHLSPGSDYVAKSGSALGAVAPGTTIANEIPAYGGQHGFAEVLDALARAGFVLARIREHPYANGCRLHDALLAGENRRWPWPAGVARTPLM